LMEKETGYKIMGEPASALRDITIGNTTKKKTKAKWNEGKKERMNVLERIHGRTAGFKLTYKAKGRAPAVIQIEGPKCEKKTCQ